MPRFTHELLARHTEGLVALTGCRHGEVARRLLAGDREGAAAAPGAGAELVADAPGRLGRLYVELQHHLLPDDDWLVGELARLAARGRAADGRDQRRALRAALDDRELQDVLVCIRHGQTLEESAHLRRPQRRSTTSRARAELAALPPGTAHGADALTRSGLARGHRNAARSWRRAARSTLRVRALPLPGLPGAGGRDGLLLPRAALPRGRAPALPPPRRRAVVKQLAHELEVIERTGLAEFFLICWDLMRFCRERGIPAQGRGSAGDSIVAYVLGITRVDPIRHELLFERFINEGRTTYPDVDIDFASSRREEVIQYVYERYGAEHTGMVCNLVTYRARSAVREVGYALGFPRPLVDRVAKALETYDSVMVRRDLEAEGGFAEFFAAPADEAPAAPGQPGHGLLDDMGELRPRSRRSAGTCALPARPTTRAAPATRPSARTSCATSAERRSALARRLASRGARPRGRRRPGDRARPAHHRSPASAAMELGPAAAMRRRGSHAGPLALGALAGAVRPDRRLPAPSLDPRRRDAHHRGARSSTSRRSSAPRCPAGSSSSTTSATSRR